MMQNWDVKDHVLDYNLRRLGPKLRLPEDPSQEQKERWKQVQPTLRVEPESKSPAAHPSRQRGRGIRFYSATGAVAAMIALCSLLFVMQPGTPVSAHVIFDSVRQSLEQSGQITFENIQLDYDLNLLRGGMLQSDGSVAISGSLYSPNMQQENVYADFRIRRTGREGVLYADLRLLVSSLSEENWAYIKGDYVKSTGLLQELIGQFARQGIYLKLTGVGDTGAAPSPSLSEELSGAVYSQFASAADLGRMIEIIQRYCREDQLRIERSAEDPDLNILIASGFYEGLVNEYFEQEFARWELFLDRGAVYDMLRDCLKNATLEIAYREPNEVQWVKVKHLGGQDGTICLNPGVTVSEEELALAYHQQQRPAPMIDLPALSLLKQSLRLPESQTD